ncbi:hypothetical protein CBS9595_001746 [Malassezia furfur]|nr:hypothetical protein CBS9595_001746 [Malassezia furfur]
MSSHSGSRLDVTQDILIRILRTSELNLITEPMCPPPDVYITLPPLAEVRAVAEQMRPMSSEVCLAANQQGTFRLAVLDSEVVGDASWSDLEMPRVQGRDTGIGTSSREFHEVRLSMRALQNVLSSASVAKSTIACLCADYCIVLYVYLTGQPERSANNSVTGVLNFIVAGLDSVG